MGISIAIGTVNEQEMLWMNIEGVQSERRPGANGDPTEVRASVFARRHTRSHEIARLEAEADFVACAVADGETVFVSGAHLARTMPQRANVQRTVCRVKMDLLT